MKKPFFPNQKKETESPVVSHNDFPVKSEQGSPAITMPDGIMMPLNIHVSHSQLAFLLTLFGTEPTWDSIVQTMFNRATNQLMMERLATAPAQAPEVPPDPNGSPLNLRPYDGVPPKAQG